VGCCCTMRAAAAAGVGVVGFSCLITSTACRQAIWQFGMNTKNQHWCGKVMGMFALRWAWQAESAQTA
jgi:hypothetical protein